MSRIRKAGIGLGGLALAGALVWALWPDPAAVDMARVERGPMQVTLSAEGITRVREPYTITVDTTPPAAPTVDAQLTNDTTPVVTGTFDSDDSTLVSIVINGVTYTPGDGHLTVDGDTWTLVIPEENALPEGDHEVTVTVVDEAGNETTDTSFTELTIDLTPPAAPTVDPLETNDPTPLITGTFDPDDSTLVSVVVNGITYTPGDGHLTTDGNTWSLQIPPENALPEGRHEIVATAIDVAGNTAADTSANELLILITPPPPGRDVPLFTPNPFLGINLPGNAPNWIPPVFNQERSFDFGFSREDYAFLGLGRDFQQDIALTERGFKVIVIPADIPNLLLYRGVPDSYVESDNPFSFTIPVDAFVHTQPDAQVILNATLTDGSPLPDWLVFDRVTGTFEGVPPAGFTGEIRGKVNARATHGLQSEAIFRLFIGVKQSEVAAPSRTGFATQLRNSDYLPSSSPRLELASR